MKAKGKKGKVNSSGAFEVSEAGEPGETTETGENHGFGLAGMKERAELSGGSFGILSVPGGGTTVSAKWSLKDPAMPA